MIRKAFREENASKDDGWDLEQMDIPERIAQENVQKTEPEIQSRIRSLKSLNTKCRSVGFIQAVRTAQGP